MSVDAFTLKVARPSNPLWFVPLRREQYKARQQVKGLGFRFHGNGDWCKAGRCWLCKAGMPHMVWWTDSPDAARKLRDYADTDALAALDGQAKADQASRATDADVDIPTPNGCAFLPYQKAGIAWMLSRFADGQSRVILGDEMGLGKTPSLIGVINAIPECKTNLVIVPASLRVNWKREAEKWLTRPTTVVIAESAKDVPESWDGDLVLICNYEKLLDGAAAADPTVKATCRATADRFEDEGKYTIQGKAWMALNEQPLPKGLVVKGKVRKTLSGSSEALAEVVRRLRAYGSGPSLHDALMARQWDLLAVDESHRVKNDRAQQTAAVLGSFPKSKKDERKPGLVDQSARLILMTGTPMTNRIKDVWTAIHTCAPDGLGRNFFSFAKRYCAATHNGYGWDFGGSSNLAELQRRLRTEGGGVMVRRLKADVLTELPPKRRSVLALAPNGASALVRDLNAAASEREAEIAALETEKLMAQAERDIEAYNAAVAKLARVQQLAFEEMAGMRAALGEAKAPYVAEWIRDQLEGGLSKIVVFAHHKAVVAVLMRELAEFGPVQLTGETPMDVRQRNVDRFQTDPCCRVFVGNMQAAGVGITLTAASTVAFAELDWTPANVLQSEDRCHRIGQHDSVNVYHLVFDGSLDQRMAELLVQKMDAHDQALDRQRKGGDDEVVELDATEVRSRWAEWKERAAEKAAEREARRTRGYVPAQLQRARNREAADFTPEQREAIHTAMRMLAGMCDGAIKKDGAGFSKPWVKAGHWLASLPELDNASADAAFGACVLFRRQLPKNVLEAIGIE